MFDASETLDATGYESPFVGLAELEQDAHAEAPPQWESDERPTWSEEFQVATPTATGIAAGRHTVDRHPLIASHRGTPPDLILRWNAMPNTTATLDVVVHLHGYSGRGQRMRITEKEPISGLDLESPDRTTRRTRPTLTLLPRGNHFGGRSGAGYSFPQLVRPGALLQLVDDGLARFRALTGSSAQRGRLLLTAHSGGGAPLNAILRHTDVDEVQVFDGLYGDASPLIAWAKKQIAAGAADHAMAVLYVPGTGTAKQSQRVGRELCGLISQQPQADALRSRFRVEATRVAHNDIPKTFGWRLLADAGGTLPGTKRFDCLAVSRKSESLAASEADGESVADSYAELEAEAYAEPEWEELEELAWEGEDAAASEWEDQGEPDSESEWESESDRARGVVRRGKFVKCAGSAQPGAKALAAQWTRVSGIKAGTYNCRNTVFGTPSLHGEGRAIDCYANVNRPEQKAKAEGYIAWLQANAVELQVAVIIWNRRIWAWHRRTEGWRAYKGNPHTDHFHVEMSWEGAKSPSRLFQGVPEPAGMLTPLVQKARSYLGFETDETPSPHGESSFQIEAEFLAEEESRDAQSEASARFESSAPVETESESTAENAKAVIRAQTGKWGTDEAAVFSALRALSPAQMAEVAADPAVIDILNDELSGSERDQAGAQLARGRVGTMARGEVNRILAAAGRQSLGTLAAAMARDVLLGHQEAFDRTGVGTIHGSHCTAPKPAGATTSDCTEYVKAVLGQVFAAHGLTSLWTDILREAVRASGRPGLKGTEIIRALQSKHRWEALFWSPDPRDPADGTPEHPYAYRVVGDRRTYYDIAVDPAKSVINYRRTKATNSADLTGIDRLRRLQFGVLAARGGTHMAMIVNGSVYEVHWSSGADDRNAVEATPLERFEWQSGAIAAPRGDLALAWRTP